MGSSNTFCNLEVVETGQALWWSGDGGGGDGGDGDGGR